MDILILIGSFAVVCLLGMPVAYALGLAAILAALWIDIPLEAVMLKVSGGMSGFSLLAIPFFILCGAIMAVGGMAERLVNLAKVFVGFIRGGMALVNIVASTMFGCISGSSVADTAAVGSVMIPQMIKNGYPRLFAVNVTISGSLQPLLLPPSHNMIIYSLAAGGTISVAQLFMGGVIPALLLGLSLIVLVLIIAHREKFPKGEVVPLRQALKIALDAVWGLITIVIILGGILTGVFTPTESAAVACVYAFFVTMFVYRDCKWRDLPRLIARVIRTVGMVMIMIGFSIAFGYMMAIMQIPAKATEFFVAISSDKYTFLLYVNVLLLLLGTFMDLGPMLLICTPIFLPVIKVFGIDPGAFRHHHDPQSRHRAADPAGRADDGGRLRHRRREHGGGVALDPDLLRSDADRAGARHLYPRAVALAAAAAAAEIVRLRTRTARRRGSVVRLATQIGGHHARVPQHVGRRAFGQRAAVVEHVNAVGEIGHHLHVVLDPDHGDAELMLDAQDEARQVLALVAVEPGRRLVEHEQASARAPARGQSRRPSGCRTAGRPRARADSARARRTR